MGAFVFFMGALISKIRSLGYFYYKKGLHISENSSNIVTTNRIV